MISIIQREDLKSQVIFFNADGQDELSALYRITSKNKSIFCNVALYEPFGLSLIEAMACGLPVVATKNGGPSEILRDSEKLYGVLVDPEDVQNISEGFRILLKNEQNYRKFREMGIKRVISKFTWDSTAKGYLQAIEEKLKNFSKSSHISIPKYFINGSSLPKLVF